MYSIPCGQKQLDEGKTVSDIAECSRRATNKEREREREEEGLLCYQQSVCLVFWGFLMCSNSGQKQLDEGKTVSDIAECGGHTTNMREREGWGGRVVVLLAVSPSVCPSRLKSDYNKMDMPIQLSRLVNVLTCLGTMLEVSKCRGSEFIKAITAIHKKRQESYVRLEGIEIMKQYSDETLHHFLSNYSYYLLPHYCIRGSYVKPGQERERSHQMIVNG